MANTFKEYLSEVEQTISFDPENETPEEVAKRAKLASRKAASSPERAIRMRQQNIKDKSAAIKQDEDDQFANERLAIKKMEERIARMKMMLARKEDMAARK